MRTTMISQGVSRHVKVSNLLLDNENPRLPPDADKMDQDDLLSLFERDFYLEPIAQSMVDNGYFAEEPLVVIPKPKSEEMFIVVEGNRRLAALKFLTEPEKRRLSRAPEYWDKLAHGERIHKLNEVPVVVYETRDQLIAMLGIRHIAGISKWDAKAKARFIDSLVTRRGKYANYVAIARETGTTARTIRDNYIAYRVYCQAKDEFDIDTTRLEKSFGVFFRALSSEGILKFIGLNKNKSIAELRHPIPKTKAEAIKEFIGYAHGTKELNPVISDSRMLTKLGEVLASPGALDYLRINRDLESSFALAGGEDTLLIRNLKRASYFLDESLKNVHRHKQDAEVQNLVDRCVATITEIVDNFPVIRSKLRGAS